MEEYVVTEPISLSDFTDKVCAQASFCFRTLLRDREIRVNGEKVGRDLLLKKGDVVRYYLTSAQASRSAFLILYEDDNVVVVDKESGVNSEAVFRALCKRGETYFLHRLDRNTAGVMIFAKNTETEREILDAFRKRRVEKIYHALVLGKMPAKHEVLSAYLRKDEKNARVRVSSTPIGERIVTEYEVLVENGETSLLKITLHTGKTHQIRAHMAYFGHPVVGDEKYGDEIYNRSHHVMRQQLIAKSLRLTCEGRLSYLNATFSSERSLC